MKRLYMMTMTRETVDMHVRNLRVRAVNKISAIVCIYNSVLKQRRKRVSSSVYFVSSCQSHMGSRLPSRAEGKWLKRMWPLRVHQGWPAKTRLRPGIAHGRGPLLHRRDSWTLHCSLPLFATQTTTTERIRDIQSHGVASTQQTPPSNQPF